MLKGKKLLILGATAGEVSLVERAQNQGIYVVVTDSNLDYKLSPAKYVADEVWDISWSDIDLLERKCLENHIDGVVAGYSEFRVENMIRLCERLGFPCYISMEQLEITRDKIKFKQTCREYDIPVVNEYATIEDVNRFPVIVKPVDRAGSIGISIAKNHIELKKAYEYAMEMSICKQVIIEDYITDATKVDVYYAVENGEIKIISSCDTINAASNMGERVVQSSWLYPQRKNDEFLEKVDNKLRSMIKGMGINYGCIFFSGFVNANCEFVFFECGFRLEGGHQYEYVSRKENLNYLDLFINHALTGESHLFEKAQYNKNLKCVTINLYAQKGIISKISGVEKIREMEDCSLALIHSRVGQQCDANRAILTKIGMFSFCNESTAKLKEDVAFVYDNFSVEDELGNDMIYDRIDSSVIVKWWS